MSAESLKSACRSLCQDVWDGTWCGACRKYVPYLVECGCCGHMFHADQ